ncbi:hypothetical protein [Longispora albida]|uniref:hypothetical protein n=1 Tax=Longispora albida TaxID=203523 RepID=UPI0003647661|nr:hypothetical protein [Longispora albida]
MTTSRRRVLAIAALALVPVLAFSPESPVHAAPAASTVPRDAGADVTGDAAGFTAPDAVPAGISTFRVSTTNQRGIRFGIVRLNDGVDLGAFLGHLKLSISGHGPEAQAAAEAVSREAVMTGGAITMPGRTASVSAWLNPGTYHLVDYVSFERGSAGPVVRALTAGPVTRLALPPVPRGAIVVRDSAAGSRFSAPAQVPAGSALLVANQSSRLNEAVLMRLRPEAQAADIPAFFEAVSSGQWPSVSPFDGLPMGVPPLSPGQVVVSVPGLAAGRYAVVTWFTDPQTGRMYAAQGSYALITVS